jgi:hypothetical protein
LNARLRTLGFALYFKDKPLRIFMHKGEHYLQEGGIEGGLGDMGEGAG